MHYVHLTFVTLQASIKTKVSPHHHHDRERFTFAIDPLSSIVVAPGVTDAKKAVVTMGYFVSPQHHTSGQQIQQQYSINKQ
jgi:hypothetical protein